MNYTISKKAVHRTDETSSVPADGKKRRGTTAVTDYCDQRSEGAQQAASKSLPEEVVESGKNASIPEWKAWNPSQARSAIVAT